MTHTKNDPSTPAPSGRVGRSRRASACLAAAALVLAGCATDAAWREANALFAQGQADAGLQKLTEAVRQSPHNVEYRIALVTRRAALIDRWLAMAENARRDGRLDDAETSYRHVLDHDPQQSQAQQGLDALALERRQRNRIALAEAALKPGDGASYASAQELLRPVLAENPNHREALRLKMRIDEARLREVRTENRLGAAARKPVTLEFRDAPLTAVFDFLSKVSGLSFFFDKDIRTDARATILVKNTTIEDALRLLLATHQLEQKVLSESTVLIYPITAQKLKDYQALAVRTFHLANADVKTVSTTLKTIVKTKDLVVDERLGVIIMRDTPQAIRIAERIVALQDQGDPEVMLDVEILEIKRSRLLELGVRWPAQLTLSPLQSGTAPLTLNHLRRLDGDTIQADLGALQLNARKEDQSGNVLANPRIRVKNREKAKILIGDRVPVITTTSTSTGFVSESVSYVDVGLKLDVEPLIYLDDEVAIKINLEVSSLVREVVSKSGTLSYQIGTRGANTVLRLRDGETQTLAGLISDEDRSTANKVPGAGELPVLGRLFGSTKDDSQRSEILLSITPHVVRSLRRPDLVAAEFDSGTESSMGVDPLRLNVSDAPPPDKAAATTTRTTAGTSSGTTPASSAASMPTRPDASSPSLTWQLPDLVKAGDQFSAILRLSSEQRVRSLPITVAFDPRTLQVLAVQEGEFFKPTPSATRFTQRVDNDQGRIFAVPGASASDAGEGVNGSGSVVVLRLKALASAAATHLQLLSALPEPPVDPAPSLPAATLRIAP